MACTEPTQQAFLEARLKQMEETCREAERRRVEVELSLMEVKENLRKVEAGPFTLGTTVDSSLLEASTVSMTTANQNFRNLKYIEIEYFTMLLFLLCCIFDQIKAALVFQNLYCCVF